MEQEELFHEDWRDALKHLVKALGGFEAVGSELWPERDRKKAGDWLSDMLNPGRAAKPDLEDIEALLRIGRRRGIHCAMHYLATEAGYAEPQPVEPEDEKAKLQRQFIEAQENMQALVKRMERING